MLGADHPVARAARIRRDLAGQAAVVGVLLAGSVGDLLARGRGAVVLFSAALVVELGLVSALAFANSHLRERARDVIADVEAPVFAAEIAAERARLAGQRCRTSLGRSLERALEAAEHWHRLSITSRPPPTVRHLLECADTTRAVIRLVLNPATPVRGVALVDRLVCGGFSSVLYAGCPETLMRELGRIRFVLSAAADDHSSG